MAIKDGMQRQLVKKACEYLEKDPMANLPKVWDIAVKLDTSHALERQMAGIKPFVTDPNSNWYGYICDLFRDIDNEVMQTIFTNFVVNSNMVRKPLMEKAEKELGVHVPWAILMDPTSACNLHCTGCWAAEYGNRLNMTFDELDSIIEQGKELGIFFYIYSGGEPMVRKDDIIALCNKHPDCEFLAFTNGTLIDEKFADDMLRVKNFIPAISVEGFEEDTDFRRGKGTYKKVCDAMALLKKKRLPFGVSCCYTSKNVDTIGSEEYYDWMIESGAKFCWFFTYMPVGNAAVPELMATAEQRKFMYRQVRAFRKTKRLFTLDFWNDGEFVHGCIAGGRNYCHINANGDVEPCAFIHYSDSNIHDKTLKEAFSGPLFKAYQAGQPFNCNHLRPCPLLDNPGRLAQIVHESGAHSTDMESPEDVDKLCEKCREKAEKWAPVADELWKESGRG